ncbi:Uncharacterized membrane protein HdeD, DUF308 family [Sulfitobacter marinus]|uniref:Uncharacterized membrane protein HdeD, DUF308 family n=1 Tax=Sulfitobacter marinus TaxID=394264 RepID=A0A1I6QRZ9_9RHOB|nr:HdeD family acid-resistance protein [Sulfitobacter marinus]SFS55277.1 Uncharacterized membrane protein HdeD, DUF308 family [Sulfitobacter marinus]
MTMNPTEEFPFADGIKRGRNVMIALGVVMIIVGFTAIVFPFISTLSVVWITAVMLIIASIAQTIGAFSYPKWSGVILGLLVAAVWLFAGVYLMFFPLEGVVVLTIVLAAMFLTEGVIKTVLSFRMRPLSGWGWLLFDGLITALLGGLLIWQMPSAALWALGTLAGISIMISGWSFVMIPIAVSRAFGDFSETDHAI